MYKLIDIWSNTEIRKIRGAELKKYRKSLGLSLREFGKKFKVDHSTLSKMERGLINVRKFGDMK